MKSLLAIAMLLATTGKLAAQLQSNGAALPTNEMQHQEQIAPVSTGDTAARACIPARGTGNGSSAAQSHAGAG